MEMSDNLAYANQFNDNGVGNVNAYYAKEGMQPGYARQKNPRAYQVASTGLMSSTGEVKPSGAPMPFKPNQQSTIKGVFGSQVPGTFDMDINPNLGNINL